MFSNTNDIPRLTWQEASARRLDRHGLAAPLYGASSAAIARAMCGAHAQILSAGEHSIALRSEHLTRADVRKALWDTHSLIKTYGPRGTVHLLPADDLPVWSAALVEVTLAWEGKGTSPLLTPDQRDAIVEAIAVILKDRELTADELTGALADHAGPWAAEPAMDAFQGKWPRWRAAMADAANRGALCFGPNRGRKATYTSPRRWVKDFPVVGGTDAISRVIRHYLQAYGPATPRQVAQWLNAPPRWMSEHFRSLEGELQQVEFDGAPAWVVAGDLSITGLAPEGVRLLPYFDAFVVGSHPRDRLFPGRAAERALAGGQAGNFPVLLVDGEVAGVWHLRRAGRMLHITVEPLDSLTPALRQGLDGQIDRLAEILQGTPDLTIGPITVGAHA